MLILDTNVVSALMRPAENRSIVQWLDKQPPAPIRITSISVMEIRFGLLLMSTGRKRSDLVARFDAMLLGGLGGRIVPFDTAAAEQAALISVQRRVAGRPIQSNDAQIAGIALSRNAGLATRNVKDFSEIGLSLVDPWSA